MRLRCYHLSLTFVALITLTTTFGQRRDGKSNTLLEIRNLYQQINSYKNYKTITIDDAEEFLGHATDNGGSLTGYYKGDTLKKVVEWVGLSNRVIQSEYYFEQNKLFFVYSTESRYRFNDSTQSFDYSKLDKTFNGRYYFSNGKLIDAIISGVRHESTKQEDASEFLESSVGYLKMLKAKLN
ncbi:hypothetical protein [Chitinophaga ginsengisoli]|uniref:Uncharacterized protein n=1 Tax=Chitinophaga ginsengisoli TaxID=363837 RepID=A0A2P8FXI1_9BACT|nr:hypothetical protein [Chitinophaga ginsengisoli]PSL26422.1 hypothetical protein CLV42_111134 [Chitinophaga ginsengisoli]